MTAPTRAQENRRQAIAEQFPLQQNGGGGGRRVGRGRGRGGGGGGGPRRAPAASPADKLDAVLAKARAIRGAQLEPLDRELDRELDRGLDRGLEDGPAHGHGGSGAAAQAISGAEAPPHAPPPPREQPSAHAPPPPAGLVSLHRNLAKVQPLVHKWRQLRCVACDETCDQSCRPLDTRLRSRAR